MDEQALIEQAQNGDAAAFEALLGMHYDTLFKFAWKWCGTREDAEDVTQQACLKLARTIGQFRFEAAFTSWLYRLVVNCARDWSKSQRRHAAGRDDERPLAAEPAGADAEDGILLGQVLEALDAFPDGVKETVLLVHAEGLTHGEAAVVLGVKESTVSWRLHEARKKLRLLFEREVIQ